MKRLILQITQWWKKYFVIWLALFVLMSYGQMLKMHVWKDDNAIFFKFTHLEEEAGYLGKGWWGTGPYKFSVTPYLLVYRLFGYENIAPYYALTLFFYYITALTVCVVFSEIISPQAGRVAGWLFACGYIASEGFIWLASAMILNVSVILSCLVLFWYFRFLKSGKVHIYFISLVFYGLAIFWTPVRTHYLIAGVIFGEFLWATGKMGLQKIGKFVVRVIPFLSIFYWYAQANRDPRIGLTSLKLLQQIGTGQIYRLSSFFGSLGQMVLPDRQINWISGYLGERTGGVVGVSMVEIGAVILAAIIILNLARPKIKVPIRILAVFLGSSGGWFVLARMIGLAPQVNTNTSGLLSIFVGGLFLEILVLLIWLAGRQTRRLIIFLLIWLLANLTVYISYQPTAIYPSFDRYLAHSFVPLVGLGGLAFVAGRNASWRTVLLRMGVVFWGIMNLYNSVVYQREIVLERSQPAREFYGQLKEYLPEIGKGNILYFDVDSKESEHFNAAFSVGQMPETTALAWRYGLDRYDITMLEDYESTIKVIKERKAALDEVFSFWYSKEGLVDTTGYLRDFLQGKLAGGSFNFDPVIESRAFQERAGNHNIIKQEDMEILLDKSVIKSVPVTLSLKITASFLDGERISYPFFFGKNTPVNNRAYRDINFIRKAVDYGKYKNLVMKSAEYRVSSEWQDRTVDNLHDGDYETVWQADRVRWDTESSFADIDLGYEGKLAGVVWINGFADSTPIRYKIEVSTDNIIWQVVRETGEIMKVDYSEPQVVSFSPVEARFVRISLLETLNNDSPEIAEFWPIDSEFSEWDILELEKYFKETFREVKDRSTYDEIVRKVGKLGAASVYWLDDDNEWVTNSNAKVDILYDASPHIYQVLIPAGGIRLRGIKISNFTVPGTVSIKGIEYKY